MEFKDNKIYIKTFGVLAIANILVYIVYHISYLLGFNWFEYVRGYIAEIWEFIMPAMCASLMLIMYTYHGFGRAMHIALITAGCRMFYCIPYYYMYYMNAENLYHNSEDAIIVSIAISIGMFLITILHLLLIFGIVLLTVNPKKQKNISKKDFLAVSLEKPASFDFSEPCSAILLTACIVQFIIKLVFTVADTVSFLVEVGESYQIGEVLFILLDYILIIGAFVLAYYATLKMKNALVNET